MVTEYTPNINLYKWKTTDPKQTTIEEMANNSDKIDAELAEFNAHKAAEATETELGHVKQSENKVAGTVAKRDAKGQVKGFTPFVMVNHDVNQSIPSGAWTTIFFNREIQNNDGMYSISDTSIITITEEGEYIIDFGCVWDSNNTGKRIIEMSVDNTPIKNADLNPSNGSVYHSITSAHYCTIGNVIRIKVYQDSGSALNVKNAAYYSPILKVIKVGD